MTDLVYAMGTFGGSGGGQGSGLGALIPLVLMFVIFYFLLIRPQQKKSKQHQELLKNLKRGDRVITTGGIYGRITDISDTTVSLEISDKVTIKVGRNFISGIAAKE
jgi:preprotein translocase subunit YajC